MASGFFSRAETSAGSDRFAAQTKSRWKPMGSYHLYYLRNSQVVGSDDIEAPDDDAAIRLAKDQGKGDAVEVWNAHSRIRIVAPSAAL
jgi:hypothetical protein